VKLKQADNKSDFRLLNNFVLQFPQLRFAGTEQIQTSASKLQNVTTTTAARGSARERR